MPPDFWTDAEKLTTSGLLVAAVALPVGLIARALRPKGESLLPRWKPWRVPWSGYEVLGVYLIWRVLPILLLFSLHHLGFYAAVYRAEFPSPDARDVDPERLKELNTVRGLWAYLFALPLTLGFLWFVSRLLYPKWEPALLGRGSFAGKLWLAILAWLAVTPVVLIFNAIVNAISVQFDVQPEQHALTRLGNRPPLDQVLFALQACLIAPLMEELFFRGILLAWCVGRLRVPGAGVSPLTDARPWFVMVAVGVLAALEGQAAGPVAFAGLLAVGLAVLWRFTRVGARRARAVYATAALFAVVHSSVWPNPIPLFVLGVALGWLAVRTNGILVPVVVHGLFNMVSVVFVLRS